MDKLLYITKISRLYIEPTVAFLCTQVEKVMYMMGGNLRCCYLKSKAPSMIEGSFVAYILQVIYTWIDAAFSVYNNM